MSDWLNDLSPEVAATMIKNGDVVLIDVREPNEFVASRIPGALLHPLSTFDPAALPADPNRPVIFHCAGGVRSATAAEKYRDHVGCDRVGHIAGGLGAWAQCGLPVIEAS